MESLSKNHLAKILRYKHKKFIEKDNLILVEGYRLLKQIAEYNIEFEELYISKDAKKSDLSHLKYKNIFLTPTHYFDKISQTKNPQHIAALIRYNPLPRSKNFSKALYLENIKDPGNLGTIIRSAVAFGFDEIFLSNESVSPLNDKVIRASMGAVFTIPIIKKDFDLLTSETDAKILVAHNSNEAVDIKKFKPKPEKFLIVIGSEAFGVSNKVLKKADNVIKIPVGNMESLNAAISASIFMYEFYENR